MKYLFGISLIICMVGCSTLNGPDKVSDDSASGDSLSEPRSVKVTGKKIPKHIYDHIEQGNHFLSRRNYDKAIEKYVLVNELSPDIPQVHYNLGVAYYQQNKENLAIPEWETAIKLDSNYSAPYLNLGYAYEKLANNHKALENYYKFLQLDPDSPKVSLINNKINLLRKYFVGQGLIGKVTVSDKVSALDYQALDPKEIFYSNVPAIYVTAEVGDAKKNTKIKAVWYYQGLQGEEILVNSTEKVIEGPQNMVFELARPAKKAWPLGRYEIRIYVDSKENLSVPFTILKGEGPKNAKSKDS